MEFKDGLLRISVEKGRGTAGDYYIKQREGKWVILYELQESHEIPYQREGDVLNFETTELAYGRKISGKWTRVKSPEVLARENALRHAEQMKPADAKGFAERGSIWYLTENYAKAIPDFEEAIRLDPTSPLTYNELAWLLATVSDDTVRNGAKAMELAQKACELSKWAEPHYIDTLAAAYAEAGKFNGAVHYQQHLLKFKTYSDQNKEDIQYKLKLYQEKQPYRQ